uniref:Uncharacterized protein n=1 Tax=Arundo donax TaxID=35708 RepID=A0A0A9EF40_ARUDO
MMSGGTSLTTLPFPAVSTMTPASKHASTKGPAGTSSSMPTMRPIPRTSFT